jgi:hypothetical protein
MQYVEKDVKTMLKDIKLMACYTISRILTMCFQLHLMLLILGHINSLSSYL